MTIAFILVEYKHKHNITRGTLCLIKLPLSKTKKQTTFKGEELEEICAKNVLEYNTNLDHYKPSDFGYESYLALLKAIIYDGQPPYLTDDACKEYGEEDQVLLNQPLFEHFDEEEITLRGVLWDAFEYSRALLRAIGA